MTITQLKYIVALDTYRHFVTAAEKSFVSQPTLSMQVQKLEEELGIEIFDRTKKPISPTDLGKKVIAQARVTLRENARIKDLVNEANSELIGELRLGIIPTLSPYLLPLTAPLFAKLYPKIQLNVHEMTTVPILENILTDKLDAGFIATVETEPSLIFEPIFTESFVAFVASDHRLATKRSIELTDLSLEDMWLLQEGHCFRDQVLELCGKLTDYCSQNCSICFESGNLETLMKMIERSGGMTLLPFLATIYLNAEQKERYLKTFSASVPKSNVPKRDVFLVRNKSYLKRHLIEAYVNTVMEVLPEELYN